MFFYVNFWGGLCWKSKNNYFYVSSDPYISLYECLTENYGFEEEKLSTDYFLFLFFWLYVQLYVPPLFALVVLLETDLVSWFWKKGAPIWVEVFPILEKVWQAVIGYNFGLSTCYYFALVYNFRKILSFWNPGPLNSRCF
jgi:hypothetical protein